MTSEGLYKRMMNKENELVYLISFHDALEAGTACQHLEQAGIAFELENRSVPAQAIDRFREGPALWMDVSVDKADLKSAQALLRSTMSLFPEREVWGKAVIQDDPEVMVEVVSCETLAEAQEIKNFLHKCNLQSEIRELCEEEEFLAFSVEIMESDLDRAFLALEEWPNP